MAPFVNRRGASGTGFGQNFPRFAANEEQNRLKEINSSSSPADFDHARET